MCACGQSRQKPRPVPQSRPSTIPNQTQGTAKKLINQLNTNQSLNQKTQMRMIDGRIVRVHST